MGNKQLPGIYAPDGAYYVTLTDGSSNLAGLVGGRTLLKTDTTFHIETVANGGNDSTGTGSVAKPFATLQACYQYIASNFDFGGHNVFMQIGAGTFTSGLDLNVGGGAWVGGGSLQIDGTAATDGSTHHLVTQINMTGTAFTFSAVCAGAIQVGLIYFASAGNLDCISVTAPNNVIVAAVEFGPVGTGRHCVASVAGANIIFNDGSSNYITGLSAVNFLAANNGYIQMDNQNFTIAGNAIGTGTPPNGTVVFQCLNGGVIAAKNVNWHSTTWNNAGSVFKYFLSVNGVLNTGGAAGVTAIPGALSLINNGGITDSLGTFQAAASVLAFFNGSFTYVSTGTVASLAGLAAAFGVGARAFATDANATIIAGIGTTAVGGGTNKVPVYSDGTNWIIG